MSTQAVGTAPIRGEHVVSFYETEAELFELIAPQLRDALQADETAIVIATPEHRTGLVAALRSCGVQLECAGGAGRLHLLDASETLARFVTEGHIEVAAFWEVIGGLLATQTGPVTVYGEMVALLWDVGAVVEAMQLESLWNQLAAEVPFSLFCAYPARVASELDHAEALAHVCRQHDSVLGPSRVRGFSPGRTAPERAMEFERVFAPRVDSIAGARRFIVDALRAWPLPYLEAASAALVVSELATNAIVHADSQFGVNVRRTRTGVRITVSDTGSSAAALTVQRTHGLGIVSALAERWGVCATAEGKAIWAELPIHSRVSPA